MVISFTVALDVAQGVELFLASPEADFKWKHICVSRSTSFFAFWDLPEQLPSPLDSVPQCQAGPGLSWFEASVCAVDAPVPWRPKSRKSLGSQCCPEPCSPATQAWFMHKRNHPWLATERWKDKDSMFGAGLSATLPRDHNQQERSQSRCINILHQWWER